MPRLVAPALAPALALAVALVALPRPAAAAAPGPTAASVAYRPPVDAPITDGFRPPATPFGPGNRGVDYATTPGQPVVAAAPGTVTFAGPVGGSLHVVVLHADGIRTSYSFLASVAVHRGDQVGQGQPVGTAGPELHFGARNGDVYLDPLALLDGGGPRRAHLVPEGDGPLPPEVGERTALEQLLGALRTGGRVGAAALAWARTPVRLVTPTAGVPDLELAQWLAHTEQVGAPFQLPATAALAVWQATHGPCTPASTPTPKRQPSGARRLAVLVGGLGSTSKHAAIDDLDTAALGYLPDDTFRFSYLGGDTRTSPYQAPDTEGDLDAAGLRLRHLLGGLHESHPGVTIDVFAHSQGGLVARVALAQPVPGVAHLVTFATPHQGADLAATAAVAGANGSIGGTAIVRTAGATRALGFDPASRSVTEMAPGSPFLRALARGGSPPGVRVLSIGARGDAVVPSLRTRLPGAANVVVTPSGVNRHATLPGSPAAAREVALALADLPPTCQGLLDALVDAASGAAIQGGEDVAVDHVLASPAPPLP
jgi:triacylglycerol esterase/lipase EstA (alpha/beta hydrolase family)